MHCKVYVLEKKMNLIFKLTLPPIVQKCAFLLFAVATRRPFLSVETLVWWWFFSELSPAYLN